MNASKFTYAEPYNVLKTQRRGAQRTKSLDLTLLQPYEENQNKVTARQ